MVRDRRHHNNDGMRTVNSKGNEEFFKYLNERYVGSDDKDDDNKIEENKDANKTQTD